MLRATGLSYQEVANVLQVSKASITSDIAYIRSQAKETIKEYTTEHLPEQYQVCLSALDTILKNAFVIMTKSEDNREKLQALQLFKDTHLVKLELLSNATTIDTALNYIRSKQQQHAPKSVTQKNELEQQRSNDEQIADTGKQSVF
jgi:hypothetical protein